MEKNIKEIADILLALVSVQYFWYLGTNEKKKNQQLKNKNVKDGSYGSYLSYTTIISIST